jgi:hypothetical protein
MMMIVDHVWPMVPAPAGTSTSGIIVRRASHWSLSLRLMMVMGLLISTTVGSMMPPWWLFRGMVSLVRGRATRINVDLLQEGLDSLYFLLGLDLVKCLLLCCSFLHLVQDVDQFVGIACHRLHLLNHVFLSKYDRTLSIRVATCKIITLRVLILRTYLL